MASKVLDTVNRYRKIEDVTSTKDDTPPVYLMDELAELAISSSDHSDSMAEHINKRLTNQSPVVKWKALRLVRHLCIKGCTHFQRAMQRYSGSIRDLLHYQGDKDPFKGDSVNARVRDSAKEVLELVYSSSASTSIASRTRIQGFGSSGSVSGLAAAPPSESFSSRPQLGSSRMVGFGSDGRSHTMQPPTSASSDLTASVSTAMSNLGGLIRSQFPSGNREHTSALHQRSGSYGDGGYTGFSGGDGPQASSLVSRGMTPSASNLRVQPANISAVMGSEEQLVNNICAPVGLRAAPDPADLRNFVESASSMDGLRIGELLIEKMNSPSWQVVLRSLYALEAVLLHGSSQACGEVAVMFQSDPTPVTCAVSSVQTSVRERASRCLKLLLNEDSPDLPLSPALPSRTIPAAQEAAASPLVNFGINQHAESAKAPKAVVQQAPIDFLGELDGPVPAMSQKTSLSQQPATQMSSQPPQDPFSTMDMTGFHVSAPPSTTAPQPVQLGAGASVFCADGRAPAAALTNGNAVRPALDDFFSSLTIGGNPPANVAMQQQPGLHQTGLGLVPPVAVGASENSAGLIQARLQNLATGSASSVALGMPGSMYPQQHGTSGVFVMPGGTVGIPGITAVAPSAPTSNFNGLSATPMMGASVTMNTATWMPQATKPATQSASWMTPSQPQPPSNKQLSDSAFDFVKDHFK